MYKRVLTTKEKDTIIKLIRGAHSVAQPVSVTFGPGGHNVIIEKGAYPIVTKDGVTVASHILPSDPVMRQAALIVRQAAEQTVKEAGDGTTTACILTSAILSAAITHLENSNVFTLTRAIKAAWKEVDQYLADAAITHNEWDSDQSFEVLKNIAALSANNDMELGEQIAKAAQWAGKDGVIVTKVSDTGDTWVEHKTGVSFETGIMSTAYYTDQAKKIAQYDDPLFVLIDDKVDRIESLMPFINAWQEIGQLQTKCLVFVVGDILGDAMTSLLRNRIKGGMAFLVVKASHFQAQRREIMKDLQMVTGAADIYGIHTGIRPADFTGVAQFGRAKKVVASDKEMFIEPLNESNIKMSIAKRSKEIMSQIEENPDDEFLKNRFASLNSGISVIHVGGAIAGEAEERMMRVDDAKKSAQSAMKEGFYPGGGIMLTAAADMTNNEILGEAMMMPMKLLLENTGLPAEVMSKLIENGYIAKVKERNDMPLPVKSIDLTDNLGEIVEIKGRHVYDSAAVVRASLRNAVAAACLLITTGAVIVNENNSHE